MQDQNNEKALLKQKYKAKGCQTLSLAEYQALRAKRSRKKRAGIPIHFKFVLSTPLLIIFCFGVLFLPYIIYRIATGPFSPPKEDTKAKDAGYEDLLLKKETNSD